MWLWKLFTSNIVSDFINGFHSILNSMDAFLHKIHMVT